MTTRKIQRHQACFRITPKGSALFMEPDEEPQEGAEGEPGSEDGERENDDDAASQAAVRRFSGVAASGVPFKDEWFGNFALDLEGLEIPDGALAILRDHDPGKILGYSESVIPGAGGLEVQGALITATEQGAEVATLADNGFPWQMSVYIPPSVVEEVEAGETAEVNGHTFEGPGLIFRKAALKELTLTAVGRDASTSADFSGSAPEIEAEILDRSHEMGNTDKSKQGAKAPTTSTPAGDGQGTSNQAAQFSQLLAAAEKHGAPMSVVRQAVDGGFSAEQAEVLFSTYAAGQASSGQAAAEAIDPNSPEGRAAHQQSMHSSSSGPSGSAEETVIESADPAFSGGAAGRGGSTDDLQVLTLEQFQTRADLVQEFGPGEDGFATFSAWRKREATV